MDARRATRRVVGREEWEKPKVNSKEPRLHIFVIVFFAHALKVISRIFSKESPPCRQRSNIMLAQPHLSKVRKLIAVEMALHPPNNETFSNKFETSLWMKRAKIAECAVRTVLKAINANGMSWCLPLGVAFLDKRRRKKHFHNKNIYSLVIILSMTPQQQIKASLERSFHLRSRHEMWDVCREWDGKERTETLRPVNMSPKSQKWVRSVRDAELSMQITLREHNGNEGEPGDKHKQNISIKGQAGIDKVSSCFGKNSRL